MDKATNSVKIRVHEPIKYISGTEIRRNSRRIRNFAPSCERFTGPVVQCLPAGRQGFRSGNKMGSDG